MLCINCKKKQASIFWEQNANGEIKRICLCASCASSTNSPGFISPEFDESVFANMFSLAYLEPNSNAACPLCQITLREIVKSGRVGCPKCYETFMPELSSTLCAIHLSTVHTGRMPAKFAVMRDRERRLGLLRAELKYAVEREDFERCAIIRDNIREIGATIQEAEYGLV